MATRNNKSNSAVWVSYLKLQPYKTDEPVEPFLSLSARTEEGADVKQALTLFRYFKNGSQNNNTLLGVASNKPIHTQRFFLRTNRCLNITPNDSHDYPVQISVHNQIGTLVCSAHNATTPKIEYTMNVHHHVFDNWPPKTCNICLFLKEAGLNI